MDECYIVAVQDFGETYEYRYPTLEAALRFMTIEMLPWMQIQVRNEKWRSTMNRKMEEKQKIERVFTVFFAVSEGHRFL